MFKFVKEIDDSMKSGNTESLYVYVVCNRFD